MQPEVDGDTMINFLGFANHANTCFQIVRGCLRLLNKYLSPHCPFPFKDTQTQLQNRAENAALLRYVDSMRTHGHRAARIDPLDLIHREEVAALSPARYGLVDEGKKYNVNGILWTRRIGEPGEEEEWWTLREITEHLRKIYVGNIAYEVIPNDFQPLNFYLFISLFNQYMHSPSKSERLWFSHLLESKCLPSPEDAPPLVISEKNKRRIHELLARSEALDNFLQLKFPKFKRVNILCHPFPPVLFFTKIIVWT